MPELSQISLGAGKSEHLKATQECLGPIQDWNGQAKARGHGALLLAIAGVWRRLVLRFDSYPWLLMRLTGPAPEARLLQGQTFQQEATRQAARVGDVARSGHAAF